MRLVTYLFFFGQSCEATDAKLLLAGGPVDKQSQRSLLIRKSFFFFFNSISVHLRVQNPM